MRRWAAGVAVVLGLLAVALVWASVDRCGEWPSSPAALVGVGRAAGPLRVGAASKPVSVTYPVTRAGYGPPRSEATSAAQPVMARATVVEVGGQRVAVLSLETLLVTAPLREAVQRAVGLPTWVVATHTHSSVGGFDRRPAAQLAGLGAWDEAREAALVEAGAAAVREAASRLEPATMGVSSVETSGLNRPRSGDSAERRLTRVRFAGAGGPLAQWLVFSAHPALAPRRGDALDTDWPGRLSALEEADGGPVTLVFQGGGGNASVAQVPAADVTAFAEAVAAQARQLDAGGADGAVVLAWAEVQVALPRPDGTRLAPAVLRPAVENVLCADAPRVVTLAALRLGEVGLLFVPLEPSEAAARVLSAQAGVTRVLGLADGYEGYVEPEDVVRAAGGESKRQYFGAGLLERLAEGAQLAGRATAVPRE